MKKHKISDIILIFSVTAITAAFILFPPQTAAAVRRSVHICLNTIIPSLFAMTVISKLLISSGIYRIIGRPFGFIARYIFRIPEDMFPIFLISMVSGYPVGASLLADACSEGSISRRDAEKMLCWCFGSGPAFIYGTVAGGVFGNTHLGNIIFLSCTAANIIIGMIMGAGRKIPPRREKPPAPVFTAEILNSSVINGGISMLKMCSVILFMSALLSLPDSAGITAYAAEKISSIAGSNLLGISVLLRSAAEITNITYLKSPSFSLIPAVSAVISFGGLSVFMQISAVCSERLSVRKALPARLAAAGISYAAAQLLCGSEYKNTVQFAVKSYTVTAASNPPIPSICLLIMIVMLLMGSRSANNYTDSIINNYKK